MSRKKIPGKALSVAELDAVLDMDQILDTEPWNRINDFVQRNFGQNAVNESKLKLSPAQGDRTTSSRRKTRKSQGNGEKSTVQKDAGGQGSKENEASKRRSGRQTRIVGEQIKEKDKRKNGSKGESNKTWKTSKNRQGLKHVLETNAKENSILKPRNAQNAKNIGDDRQTAGIETENTTANKNETMISTTGSINSQLPVDTSTPKSECVINYSTEKKETENNASGLKKCPFSTNDVSSEKRRAKDLNNSWDEVTIARKENKEAFIKCKGDTERKETENDENSRPPLGKQFESKQKQVAKTGKKKYGKYELQLLEKRKKREERRIRRHERKAERAMEVFARHVTKIVEKMGYLPENDSYSSDDSSSSDKYYSSCSGSTCSCSCACSNCSCSCECSEYSLTSSSSE